MANSWSRIGAEEHFVVLSTLRLELTHFTRAIHQFMQSKVLKIVVGLLGFSLVAVLIFVAVSKASVLDGAKAAVALLVTLKLIMLLGKTTDETHEATVASKRNVKLIAIGLAVGLLLPLGMLWFITHSVR